MSDASALIGVPDQIRALRAFVQEHAPRGGALGGGSAMLGMWLIGSELLAEQLVEALPPEARARRPRQQIHAPIGDQAEPLVPRRSGTGLPPGRYHP